MLSLLAHRGRLTYFVLPRLHTKVLGRESGRIESVVLLELPRRYLLSRRSAKLHVMPQEHVPAINGLCRL